jgi:DNA helicase IV
VSEDVLKSEELTGHGGELAREGAYVSMLYDQLDAYRAELQHQLAEVRLAPATGTHQWRTERDSLARLLERRLQSISIGDLPLCFGRLDLDDGSRLHVGRVGIAGEGEEPLLMDWRAPKAALFYSATSGSPQGVVRRRHLLAKGREVIAIDDEIFDLDAFDAEETDDLHGDAALLAAVSRSRSGYMRDIVATIQREQDEVIRADLSGVLVVQGGPGTGKTAVALHRAAYLLYTHRMRLAQTGVLVVGPNPVFLRYIEQVLPSLGETGAVLATVHGLFPGVRPTHHDDLAVAELKGRPEMVTLLKKAIRDRQRLPRGSATLAFERSRIQLSREFCEQVRRLGRRSSRAHNQARKLVEAQLLEAGVAQIRAQMIASGAAEPPAETIADLRRGLRRSHDFKALMERMWPILTPQQLLNDLFGTPPLLRAAAEDLPDLDISILARERLADPETTPWTMEDVALLDEAAELLGPSTDEADARRARQRRQQRQQDLEFANRVLSSMELEMSISAERFAERFADSGGDTIAEQAVKDRSWKFGHVIVDEAQELSPMAWRMLFRRNPNRSMTVVGDLAQCSASWAPQSWDEVLESFASDRWRVAELTVNYRTPAEIMDGANAILRRAAPEVAPTVAIRASGHMPTRRRVEAEELPRAVAVTATEILEELEDGRLAVIAPAELIATLGSELQSVLGESFDALNPLAARVALITVADAKGLEFDGVVLVEPGEIVTTGARGLNDLYVAMTRATQQLAVLHAHDIPEELEIHLLAR